ncbi:hypothetical protein KDW_46880 [Dictyobacter vulcani]|uniref:Uncharacterized protein n=1 Tax=Dictyobacter vulcani TaxID=2607529 RepID=A0A5J4KZ89_9CHLR|nr:hypothetical protein [Dictyobacter vulcani]GER90526.1 hypothetical protein KDW_46880 [Dictyobacter vulcani]
MYLEDILIVCLESLNSRYPEHTIDINGQIIGSINRDATGWKAEELIEMLRAKAPHFLQKMAHMTVDSCETTIYLIEYSRETPAFWLHCQGKLPPCHEHSAMKKNALKPGLK